MLPYWIEEGERQVRLGLLWQRCVHLLESQGIASPRHVPWHRELRERVLEPFVRTEFVPGVADVLAEAEKSWQAGQNFAAWDGPGVFRRFAEIVQGALDPQVEEKQQRKLSSEKQCDALRQQFWVCAQFVCQTAPTLTSIPPLAKGRYYCPAPITVRIWLEQAQSLAAWRELKPELETLIQDGELRDGIQEIVDLLWRFETELANHHRTVERRKWFLPPPASLVTLLEASKGVAAEARSGFERMLSNQGLELQSGWHREIGHLQRQLADELVLASITWPPRWLADAYAELAQVYPKRLQSMLSAIGSIISEAPIDSDAVTYAEHLARLSLIKSLIEYLDQLERHSPLEPAAWESLGQQVPLLFRDSNCGWTLTLIRTENSPYADSKPVATGRPSGVRHTGIVVCRVEKGGTPEVIRRAVVEVPAPVSGLVQPLQRLARSVASSDSCLAGLCRQLAQDLKEHKSLRDWYESADSRHQHQTLLWRLMQRIAAWDDGPGSDDRGDAVALVLEAALEEGVTLEPVPLEQGDGPRDAGPWVVWAGPAAVDTRAGSGDGVERPILRRAAVRMPDGTLVSPSFCLTVPRRFLPERPLLKVLVEREAELAGLRIRDPEWCGWQTCNDQILKLASAGTSSLEDDAQFGLSLFEALFTRACERSTWQSMYRGLALALYRCLTDDLGAEITPAVHPTTGELQTISALKIKAGQWHWEVNSAKLGTPTRVERFGFRCGKVKQSAHGTLSLGENAPRELAAWLQLPGPEFLGQGWAGGEEHPLAAWWQAVHQLPYQLRDATQAINDARKKFKDWLKGAVGREWLNEFLHLVLEMRDHEASAARLWHAQLTSPGTAWFDCYPRLDAKTGDIEWPPSTTTAGDGLRWKFDDKVPRGRTLEPEIRFAPDPESAAGHFSLGRREDAEFLAALEPLQQIAARLHPTHGDLNRRVSNLVTDVREREFGVPFRGQSDSIDQRLLELLDALTSAAVPCDEDRDHVLAALTDFCRIAEYRILPLGWSFVAGECAAPEVLNSQTSSGFNTVAKPQFHDTVPRGRCYVTKLGLRQPQRLIRLPEVFRSAGQEPSGFRTFASWLQDFEKQVSDSWPAAEARSVTELIRALHLWPGKALDDVLVDGLVTFHGDYWDKLAAFAQREAPEFHKEFRVHLEKILTSQGLKLLEPLSVSRYPDGWVETEYRPGKLRGQVTQVLRPGILDERNQLCLCARVVIEG